jgi:hypothetical protein
LSFFQNKKEVTILDDGLAVLDIYCKRNIDKKLRNDELCGGCLKNFYKLVIDSMRRRLLLIFTFYGIAV